MASKKAKGVQAKTRSIRKGPKVTPNKILFPFEIGNTVDIIGDSSVNSGKPFRRYTGLTGKIVAKQGRAFYVAVNKLNKPMKVLCGPAHIRLSKGVVQTSTPAPVKAVKAKKEPVAKKDEEMVVVE